jgi:flagellar basal body rod protein FlgB
LGQIPWTLDRPLSPGAQPSGPMPIEALFPDRLFQARQAEGQPGLTFQDANNRSLEHQFLEMTKNSLLQNLALQVMAAQYGQLQAAISGTA